MLVVDEAALVLACKQRRERLRAPSALPIDKVWRCMMRWVVHQLGRCNGASIPHLCSLTWRADGAPPPTAERERVGASPLPAAQRYRALCVFHERFLQDLALKTRGLTSATARTSELARTELLNCTRLALNFSEDLTKDMVFSGSRELVATIFALIGAHRELALELAPVGVLVVRDRFVSFEFAPDFVPAAEREAALSRLAEIRRLAQPSNDPLFNRHADVPGGELLVHARGADANAEARIDPPARPARPARPPAADAASRRASRWRASTPLVDRRVPLNPGLPRDLSGGDLLLRPSSSAASNAAAQPQAHSAALRALDATSGGALAPRGAAAPALGGRSRAALRTCSPDLRSPPSGALNALGRAQVRPSTSGARPSAPILPTPTARRPPKPPRANSAALVMSLDALQLDAEERELDSLALSPVARLLPGQGAKHTPPSSPTFTAVERDLSPGHVAKPLARADASAVLKRNRCLSPGGAARMMEWLTHGAPAR
ncbi:hypothetical protein KFE25_000294 [Diacronema lutheri]|uniref:CCDC81 HU domain-containing protein n=1 Tax=Diacronema lutheri TaxID=2081491 RepID=A0A8J5X9C6_DIALT|nr:hypothetical protein KFE25_000294 [Diacronema lutheri]